MKNIYAFVLFCLVFINTSCSDWLDVKPDRSLVVPETVDDYYAMLNWGSKLNISYPCMGLLATNSYYLSNQSFKTDWQKNAFTWSEIFPYTNVPDWSASYSSILTCNLIIEGMKNIVLPKTNSELEKFKSVLGQAHFFRARYYIELAQLFAKPYDPNTDNHDLTIPIKISTDIKEKLKNSTVNDLYKLIIEDLRIASENLPMTSDYFTRPNKMAAWALFSRVYLCMSDFELCKKYSDSLVNRYPYLIDYNSLEIIGTYPFSKTELNGEIIFYNTLYNFGSSKLVVDTNLVRKFDENDLRKKVFFKYNSNGQASFIGSYAGSSLLFGGLAMDEIYLNRAEANARLGNSEEAINDVNELLEKRFVKGKFKPISYTITKDSLISMIIEERQKELVLRGIRWYDVRRLTTFGEFNKIESRIFEGIEYKIEPKSYKYTFPIPKNALDGTSLVQNEGWDR